MRIVVVLCTMLIIGTLRPELWDASYHPRVGFLAVLGVAVGIGTFLDAFDFISKLSRRARKE